MPKQIGKTAQPGLPTAEDILRAIKLYLCLAYPDRPPEAVLLRLPPPDFRPEQWLMSDAVERARAAGSVEQVRTFALRLGNHAYPHMKLRLSRPPKDPV